MFELILRETKKMVEFDDVPTGYLKSLLEKVSIHRDLDLTTVEISADEEHLNLEELKLSSDHLTEKVKQTHNLHTGIDIDDTKSEKSFKLTKAKKTYMTYEQTMDRVKLNFWNSSLWKIQVS